MDNFGQNPDDPAGHLVVEMAILGKNCQFWPPKKFIEKNVFFVDYAFGHTSSYCLVGIIFSLLVYF